MAPRGMLEIFIFGGRGLKNTDKPGNVYCIASYKDEENRTDPVECDNSDPEWNEKFQFTIADDDIDDLKIQVIDEDENGNDDDPGYCSISIEGLLETGYKADIEATEYEVFRGDEAYGDITVSMAFFQRRTMMMKNRKIRKNRKMSDDMVDRKNTHTSTYCLVV